jgi:hypothetical protein
MPSSPQDRKQSLRDEALRCSVTKRDWESKRRIAHGLDKWRIWEILCRFGLAPKSEAQLNEIAIAINQAIQRNAQ